MAMVYFPSCKFTAYSLEASRKIQSYLAENYNAQISGCCRPNHQHITPQDTVVYICNTCAAICREDSAAAKVVSVWELLAADDRFAYPDYRQRKMAVQDCWRVYDNAPQQKAVRTLLQKMNIASEELDENYEKTQFCGVSLYEPLIKQNGDFAPKRFIENAKGLFLPHTPEEKTALMEKHCQMIHAAEVVCYCNGCINGIRLGGKQGIHLLDLVFGLA